MGEGKTGSFVIARAGAVQCSYSDRRGGREGRERERERQAGAPRMQTTRTTLECITRSSINISNITLEYYNQLEYCIMHSIILCIMLILL